MGKSTPRWPRCHNKSVRPLRRVTRTGSCGIADAGGRLPACDERVEHVLLQLRVQLRVTLRPARTPRCSVQDRGHKGRCVARRLLPCAATPGPSVTPTPSTPRLRQSLSPGIA
eukprot:821875-Rhodomonas_salina.1